MNYKVEVLITQNLRLYKKKKEISLSLSTHTHTHTHTHTQVVSGQCEKVAIYKPGG